MDVQRLVHDVHVICFWQPIGNGTTFAVDKKDIAYRLPEHMHLEPPPQLPLIYILGANQHNAPCAILYRGLRILEWNAPQHLCLGPGLLE